MDLSIFVAQTMALAYLSLGLGMLAFEDYYAKAFKDMFETRSYQVFGGFISLIIGMLLVQHHGAWANDWTSLITLVGWLALIKGVMLLAFPEFTNWFKPLGKKKNIQLLGMGVVILGLVFAYFGFVA